ncbi:hypothetical protein X975_07480, partial [Stegodyphus mimosarum]
MPSGVLQKLLLSLAHEDGRPLPLTFLFASLLVLKESHSPNPRMSNSLLLVQLQHSTR